MREEHFVSSPALRGERRVWIDRSPLGPNATALLFLDAEFYLERVRAAERVASAVERSEIEPPNCAYFSYGEAADRHRDFTCQPAFSEFLVTELLPWIEVRLGGGGPVVLCGLSLSGLAALHAASRFPSRFDAVLSQSPSAWWNDEWLIRKLVPYALGSTRVWLWVTLSWRRTSPMARPICFKGRVSWRRADVYPSSYARTARISIFGSSRADMIRPAGRKI